MLKPAQKRALMSFYEASDQGIHSKLDKNPLLAGIFKFYYFTETWLSTFFTPSTIQACILIRVI